MYVKVAVPRPIDALFDYEYDEVTLGSVQAGDWVRVPFGNSKLNACVIETSSEAPALPEGVKAKPVIERLDASFRLPEEVLALCRFGSEYYQYPIGEALFAAAPPKPDQVLSARAKKTAAFDDSRKNRVLSDEQSRVVAEIRARCESRPDAAFLLEGITGSGKTEVYIELARDALAQGKSVLILVPEISLTAQLRDRFQSSLPERVALWHSALSDGVRQTQWRQVKEGQIRVVIGARSALFAPFCNLGLIVVDEEHDSTYKQEERFRYQARDLAMFRAKQRKIPIVLGSATPSLESIQRVREGKLVPLKLKSRYSKSTLPTIHAVSLIDESPVGAGTVRTPLAPTTIRAMQGAIDRGEQVMIFLNRRGYAQFLLCQACGWVQKCSQCSISMTLYQKRGELRCHVCASRARVPSQCGECGSAEVFGMGSGTESLEDDLAMVLTGAKILRLDRDQITSQKRLEETLEEFRSLRANVLIGTQMLVKGHDFPRVTCVVVVSVDSLLKWPDFRASERALQTLIQVSGRAGRAELPGNVYLQGYDLEHPVVRVVQGELSHEEFVQEELSMREMLSYPPFSRLVRFRFDHEAEDACREFALEVAGRVRAMLASAPGGGEEHRVLGPSEALLFRAQNRYRFDLYFKAPSLDLLYRVSKGVRAIASERGMNVVVDVDPYNS